MLAASLNINSHPLAVLGSVVKRLPTQLLFRKKPFIRGRIDA